VCARGRGDDNVINEKKKKESEKSAPRNIMLSESDHHFFMSCNWLQNTPGLRFRGHLFLFFF